MNDGNPLDNAPADEPGPELDEPGPEAGKPEPDGSSETNKNTGGLLGDLLSPVIAPENTDAERLSEPEAG
ncbi:hypothetical protein [Arthrobacter sp. fls2-241-R2A-200]|uniref:hypothetical protein n=1 Tax=unclassified Arthrobacter TaxID=235627 RepID=UPI002550BE36|nr:hypothetical protein [Arthrobacter sp. fls2-241-R2A-200]